MAPGPEVQTNKAQESDYGEGKIPLWPTTSSGCISSFTLTVGVKIFRLLPVSSWPQGAILAIPDLSYKHLLLWALHRNSPTRVPKSKADPKALLRKYQADERDNKEQEQHKIKPKQQTYEQTMPHIAQLG